MVTLTLIVGSLCAGNCGKPVLSMYHHIESSPQYKEVGITNTTGS